MLSSARLFGFGEYSLLFADPTSWTLLPADLRSVSDSTAYKKQLRSYLFKLAFDIQWMFFVILLLYWFLSPAYAWWVGGEAQQ